MTETRNKLNYQHIILKDILFILEKLLDWLMLSIYHLLLTALSYLLLK